VVVGVAMEVVVAAAVAMVVVAAATPGLAAAATLGSLDVEVAADSEAALGSEVAGVAAAGSLSTGLVVTTDSVMTTGSVTTTGSMGEPAADPGERAACAKSHDLTLLLGLTGAAAPGTCSPSATWKTNGDLMSAHRQVGAARGTHGPTWRRCLQPPVKLKPRCWPCFQLRRVRG